jgi:hypothetical protein
MKLMNQVRIEGAETYLGDSIEKIRIEHHLRSGRRIEDSYSAPFQDEKVLSWR